MLKLELANELTDRSTSISLRHLLAANIYEGVVSLSETMFFDKTKHLQNKLDESAFCRYYICPSIIFDPIIGQGFVGYRDSKLSGIKYCLLDQRVT